MACKQLRPDLFVFSICLIFQSLHSSFVFASLNSPLSSSHSRISVSSTAASSVQTLQSYACYPADRDALLDVAASFSFLDWRQDQDCCHWEGVTCGSPFNSTTTTSNSSTNSKLYSRVVGLALAGIEYFKATISLPLAICRLSALISLDLSWNALIGPIPTPTCWNAFIFPNSWNALIGPIPTCFSHNLTSLQTLSLGGNSFSGSLAPLANLSLLTHLDLSGNYFVSLSPLANLSLLTYLDLGGNQFTSLSPLANLSLLTHLDLSGNHVVSLSPLANLSLLTHLNLHYSRISSLSPLANLSLLTCLDLGENQLTSLSPLANLSLLTHLDLSSSQISSLSPLANLSLLTYLDLSDNQISSLSPEDFSNNPLLQYLALDGNKQITGDIRVLEHLQQLETLLILGMDVPAASLGSLFCKLGSLQLLSAYVESGYDKTAASTVLSHVLDDKLLCEKPASVNLTYLDLTGQGYTGPFPTWFAHFAKLQVLALEGNPFEGSIPQGWQALTQLTQLLLSGDSPLTPVSLSQEVTSWLFRLPLQFLFLKSMGLTSQDFPCTSFSLLNHTLEWLDLTDNHISPGHSLLHCLQHHNFSLLSDLTLSENPLAVPLQPYMFPPSIQSLNLSNCQLFGSLSSIETLDNNLAASVSIRLDLSYNSLTGIISSSIWNLTNALGVIRLDNNHLHGALAPSPGLKIGFLSIASNYLSKASFHNVSGTEVLDLSDNQLQGDLEDLLGDYSLMKTSLLLLQLDNNQLTSSGSISSSAIWNLTNALTAGVVSIANNSLSKVEFHNVSSLEILDLSSNQLGGTLESLLRDFTMMKNLKVLLLNSNQLKGSIPSSLGTLAPSLITIDLSNNMLTGAIPPSLQHLQALRSNIFNPAYLYIVYNFSYTVSFTLESVKNVKFNMTFYYRGHLDLSNNKLNGILPDGLGALVALNDLNLSRNLLSGSIPRSLAHLVSLESLDLSFNNLEGAIPPELLKLTSLEVFNVSFNPKLSGPIPEGPQLETATSYEGDHRLCGQAINKKCGQQQLTGALTPTGQEPNTLQTLGFKGRFTSFIKQIEKWVAIPGIVLGYVVGIGITILALKMLHFYN